MRDLVFALSKEILEVLKPIGKKALHGFWKCVKSLQTSISFDVNGMPSLNLGLGDIQAPATTLDEIFRYLEQADKSLESIPLEEYIRFACMHFKRAGKEMEESAVTTVYQQFEGVTWYIQNVLNTLYDMTPEHGVCKVEMVSEAIRQIIDSFRYTYSEILFRLPEKQKELLIAITKEGKAKAITSGAFIKKYRLASASSVQAALKGLLEKDFVTQEKGVYQIYDRFLGIWLKENY